MHHLGVQYKLHPSVASQMRMTGIQLFVSVRAWLESGSNSVYILGLNVRSLKLLQKEIQESLLTCSVMLSAIGLGKMNITQNYLVTPHGRHC